MSEATTLIDVDATRALERPPLDLHRLFGNDRPVELEIGCGKGRFITSSAAARPEFNFLGIERSKKFFSRTADLVRRLGLTNIRLMTTDGGAVVRHFLPDRCLAAMHIYYPDPWPKRKHIRRRLLQTEFLSQVVRVLVPGGKLFFQTDVQSYYETGLEALKATPGLELLAAGEIPPEDTASESAGTHWEHKSRKLGLSAYRLVAHRTA